MYELDESVGDYAVDLPPEIENKEEDVIVLQELDENTSLEEGIEVLEQLLEDRDKLFDNIQKLQEVEENGVDGSTRQLVAESANFRKYLEKRYLGKTGYTFANEAFYYGGDTRQIVAIESEESSNIFVKIWNAIKAAFKWFFEKISSLFGGSSRSEAIRSSNDTALGEVKETVKGWAKTERENIAKFKEATKGLDKALADAADELEKDLYDSSLMFPKGMADEKALDCLKDVVSSYIISTDMLRVLGDIQAEIDEGVRNKNLTMNEMFAVIGAVKTFMEKMPKHAVDLRDYPCSEELASMAAKGAVNAIGDFASGGMLCLGLDEAKGRFRFEFVTLKGDVMTKQGMEPLRANPSKIVDVNWELRKKSYDEIARIEKDVRARVDKIKNHYNAKTDAFVEQSVEDFNKEMSTSGKSEEEVLRLTNKKIFLSIEKDIMTSLTAFGKVSASVNRTFFNFEKELGKSIRQVKKAIKEVAEAA